MRIYLDTCCYNRQFDDQSQPRIFDETVAIKSIVNRSFAGDNVIIGSEVLLFEFGNISNEYRRTNLISAFKNVVAENIKVSAEVLKIFNCIRNQSNIHSADALHLACAEFGNTDIFLTTDDKFLRSGKNLSLNLKMFNPVCYLAEVLKNDEY